MNDDVPDTPEKVAELERTLDLADVPQPDVAGLRARLDALRPMPNGDAQRGSHAVQRLVRRIVCFFRGHPCEPTGRHAIQLMEWKCKRCGGIYVSHAHHGNAYLPADDGSDRIFRDCMDAIKTADAYPPNAERSGSES